MLLDATSKFKVKEFLNPSRGIAFRVSGWLDGRRIRENYKTHAEALTRRQELETQAANLTTAGQTVFTRLTPDQIAVAEIAFSKLGDRPMLGAVDFFLRNYREPDKKIKTADAFASFLAEKKAANCRPDTLKNLKAKHSYLLKVGGQKTVGEILPDFLAGVINRPTLAPITRNNTRRALLGFFNWAKGKGYCAANPVESLPIAKLDAREPEILSLPEVHKFMAAAAGFKKGVLGPYVATAIFAAVRPRELTRVTWEDFDLEEKILVLRGEATKMRARRVVELADNLVEWLEPYALKRLPFVGKNWRRDFDTVKELAGFAGRKKTNADGKPLRKWTLDLFRHTAISYHFAKHQHEGKTASWAGNSPDLVHRFYKGLVTPKDAAEFWEIRPDKRKVIKLRVAA